MAARQPHAPGVRAHRRGRGLVEPGELDPNNVHISGVFVRRVHALAPEQVADK